jgi:hypothetical protein
MRTPNFPSRRLASAGLVAGGALLLVLPLAVPEGDLARLTAAEPAPATGGKASPGATGFGIVHVHSIVQGNARFSFKAPSRRLQVEAPDFVTVRQIRPLSESDNPQGPPAVDVFFELNTQRAGERSGTMEVRLGDQAAQMPITASVLPNQHGLTRVLVTSSPFDRYTSDNPAVYQPLLDLVKSGKLDMSYLDQLPGEPGLPEGEKLSTYFDVILLVEAGLLSARDEDVARLRRFVDEGGRLVVTGNHFFQGTVAKANQILQPYGMQLYDTEPRVSLALPGNSSLEKRSVLVENVEREDEPLTAGVRKVRFFRPSPVHIADRDRARVLVDTPYYLDDGFAAVWRGKGEVVVLGESLWWNWIGGEQGKDTDNARLMQNLLTREKPKR